LLKVILWLVVPLPVLARLPSSNNLQLVPALVSRKKDLLLEDYNEEL
jgi:hypothetical protein